MFPVGIEDLIAVEPDAAPDVYRVSLAHGSDAATVGEELARRVGPAARTEVLDTGRADIEPLMFGLRLIAAVLFLTAGVNLLSTLLTSSRETARRTGVELAIGFTPRQLIGQGAVAGADPGHLSPLEHAGEADARAVAHLVQAREGDAALPQSAPRLV